MAVIAAADIVGLPFAAVADHTLQSHSDAEEEEEAEGVHHDGAVLAASSDERIGIAVLMLACGCGKAHADVMSRVEAMIVFLDGAIADYILMSSAV